MMDGSRGYGVSCPDAWSRHHRMESLGMPDVGLSAERGVFGGRDGVKKPAPTPEPSYLASSTRVIMVFWPSPWGMTATVKVLSPRSKEMVLTWGISISWATSQPFDVSWER